MDASTGKAGAQTSLVPLGGGAMSSKSATVDLSDGPMTRLQLFDLIDVVELASAIRIRFSGSVSG